MSIDRRRAGQRGYLRRNAGADGSTVDTVTFLNGGIGIDTLSGLLDLVAGSDSSDQFELRDIAFMIATKKGAQTHLSFTEAASNLSGTPTVTDGVHTASLELLGQYTASQFVAGRRRTRRHAHHLHIGYAERDPPRPEQRGRVTGDVLTEGHA